MPISTINSGVVDEFKAHHLAHGPDDSSLLFLKVKEENNNISYDLVKNLEQDVSNYAAETLKNLNKAVEKSQSTEEQAQIVDLAMNVVEEYESVNANRTGLQKIGNAFLVLFGFRESQNSINQALNHLLDAQQGSQKEMQFQRICDILEVSSGMEITSHEKELLLKVNTNLWEKYGSYVNQSDEKQDDGLKFLVQEFRQHLTPEELNNLSILLNRIREEKSETMKQDLLQEPDTVD